MAEGGNGQDTRQQIRFLDGEGSNTQISQRISRVTENIGADVNAVRIDAERREIRERIGVRIRSRSYQVLLKRIERKAARRGNSRAAADGEEDPVRR